MTPQEELYQVVIKASGKGYVSLGILGCLLKRKHGFTGRLRLSSDVFNLTDEQARIAIPLVPDFVISCNIRDWFPIHPL